MKIYEITLNEEKLDEFWPLLARLGMGALRGAGFLGRGALRSATAPVVGVVGGAAGIASRAYGAKNRFLSLFQFLAGSAYYYVLYEPLGRYLDTISEAEKANLAPEEFEKIHSAAMKKLIADWANIFITGKLGKYAIGIFRPFLGKNSRVLDALTPASQIAFIKGLQDSSVAHSISEFLTTSLFGDILGAGGKGIESIIKGVIDNVTGDAAPAAPEKKPESPQPSQGASPAPVTPDTKEKPKPPTISPADQQYLDSAKKSLAQWQDKLQTVDKNSPQLAAQIQKNIDSAKREIDTISPGDGDWEYYAPGYEKNEKSGKIRFKDPGSQ